MDSFNNDCILYDISDDKIIDKMMFINSIIVDDRTVLSAIDKDDYGVDNLNIKLPKHYHPEIYLSNNNLITKIKEGYNFYKGDKLQRMKNDYNSEDKIQI